MKILVGYTGFVGSNLLDTMNFDKCFNSKNISEAYDLNPNICVYAGVKAQKFVANKSPDEDFKHIQEAIEIIKNINPKKLILISTVDVLDETQNVDEDYEIKTDKLMAYGKNRRSLEEWVIKNIEDYHIVRLPALYGKNLKKNFLYDILNPIPSMLSSELYKRYSKPKVISQSYQKKDNNFYYLKDNLNPLDKQHLLKAFTDQNFTSLRFTDSRSEFQFYPLSRLSLDLSLVIKNNIHCIQLVTEPVKASEIFNYLFETKFENEISKKYPNYNLKTRYSKLWNSLDGFLMNRDEILQDIKTFVTSQREKGLL